MAFDMLAVDGYLEPLGLDPLVDEHDEIVGCTVRARNDEGLIALLDIWYT